MTVFCPTCEKDCETRIEEREETYTVRGQAIAVPVQVEVCVSCGEPLGSDAQDQQVLDKVYAEYRRQRNLLSAEEIKRIRERYCLSQKSFARLLGMSEATLNRYEQGWPQEKTHDIAIRACMEAKFVRELLRKEGDFLTDWQRERVERALADEAESPFSGIDIPGKLDCIYMPNEASERTGFRCFDYNRFAFTLVRFCRALGEVSTTMVNKLVFYADFLNFKTSTVSLTGAAYRRLEYGPALADYGNLLGRMEAEGLLVCREKAYSNGNTGYYYQAGANVESVTVELTPQEEKVLNCVIKEFRGYNAGQLSDRSHGESAWLNTEDKQFISYREAERLSLELVDEVQGS